MIKQTLLVGLTFCLLLGVTACSQRGDETEVSNRLLSVQESSEIEQQSSKDESDIEVEYFTVPPMNEDQQKYYDEYVNPLLTTALLMNDWTHENFADLAAEQDGTLHGIFLIYAFEDIIGQDEMQDLWQKYNADFPAQIVEDVLLARFPFEVNQLHEILSQYYNADTKTYYYDGGRGGGNIEGAVTAVRTEGDYVYLDYALFTGFSGVNELPTSYIYKTPGVLTLKQDFENNYLYWSVDVSEQVETIA